MRVIKDKSVIDDEWSLIRKLDSSASIPEGSVILPFSFWQANRDILLKSKKNHAIWIDGSIETESLVDDLEIFSIIALDFPTYKDGRSYSHARLLRERYGYKGELRAIGDVLQDQLFFMQDMILCCFTIVKDHTIIKCTPPISSYLCFSLAFRKKQQTINTTTNISRHKV